MWTLALGLVFATIGAKADAQQWVDPSPHIVRFVEVEPNIHLEVLDWGGSGDTVILLAGQGNTAHVFDEFAPGLTRQFRVFALTRRGFGASTQSKGGYDLTTMVGDLARVVDALGSPRVHLVGHSIAGDEMTRFAALHPKRLGKLVYLDAAYDRVDARLLEARLPPDPPLKRPTADDLSSPARVQAFVASNSVLLPEAEIRATRVFAADGRFERRLTPDHIQLSVGGMVEHPNYKLIHAPVLAVYAVQQTAEQLFPQYGSLNQEARSALDAMFGIWRQFAAEQRNLLRTELPNARVVEVEGANHYLFISNRKQLLDALASFLSEQP
jgi:non-heme chloroperoxidase